jgi:hypothetical protein
MAMVGSIPVFAARGAPHFYSFAPCGAPLAHPIAARFAPFRKRPNAPVNESTQRAFKA